MALVILIACSAFFSASETAITTANKLRLRRMAEDGDKRAKTVLELSAKYDKTLYSILIGNNLVNILSSSLATVAFTALLGAAYGPAIATAVITVAVLLFGEILPKSYANDNSMKVSLAVAPFLRLVSTVCAPFTWMVMKLKNTVSKPSQEDDPTVTEEELIYMLGSIEEEGVIEEQERDLVQSALEFDETLVREIITPRVDVVALDIKATPEEVKETLLKEGFSRIPIYDGSIDNIIGVLYARDYLLALLRGESPDLSGLLAEPLLVHRTMRVSQLLAVMKAEKSNLAVVTDDYGGTEGIVTMEDLLEELVGELWDEDEDAGALGIVTLDENTWLVSGQCHLDDLIDELGNAAYNPDTDYTTVNGWAGHIYGHIPSAGNTASFLDLRLTVLEMDGHRIGKMRIERTEEDAIKQAGSGERKAE